MDPKAESSWVWNGLLTLAREKNESNDRRISLLMGRSEDYLSVALRRRKSPTIEDALRVVKATGEPTWAVLPRLFPAPKPPAEVLRRLRAFRRDLETALGLPPPLDRLEEARALAARRPRPAPEGAADRCEARLAGIEALHSVDPDASAQLLETEIATQLARLESAKGAEGAAALATAVALWADHQRRAGRQELAMLAAPEALELAEASGDRWGMALALALAALLVEELGYPDSALEWLDRAGHYFALAGDLEPQPRILAIQGRILAGQGRYAAAAAALREALPRLSHHEEPLVRATLLALAETELSLDRPIEALACLDRVASERPADEELYRELLWRQAAARLKAGDEAAAVGLFSQAAALSCRDGAPLELGYAVLEVARHLKAAGRAARIGPLLGKLLGPLDRGKNRRLAALLEDFQATCLLHEVNAGDLEKLEKTLRRLGPPPPRRLFPGQS